MIKIRVIRETYDTATHPTIVSTEILWIGCIVSELTRIFPVASDSEPDRLVCSKQSNNTTRTVTYFEGFGNGAWRWINDPRTKRIPASEKELNDRYTKHEHAHGRPVDKDR